MEANETNVFLNALKKHAMEFYCREDESKEDLMIRLFEPIDDETGFMYIRDMHLLVRAVSFYMIYSDDHQKTKERVQHVLEQVIENDYFYKQFEEYISIFRSALGDVYKKLDETDKNK